MWDPFRYKLGGRLLNGAMREFRSHHGSDERDKYALTRDFATDGGEAADLIRGRDPPPSAAIDA
jgi:hypothetical protein